MSGGSCLITDVDYQVRAWFMFDVNDKGSFIYIAGGAKLASEHRDRIGPNLYPEA